MDFFAHEDRARRTTRRLLVLFLACVLAMIAVLCWLTWTFATFDDRLRPERWQVTVLVAIITAGTVLLASAWKKSSLASGGEAVAALMGARALSPVPSDPLERTLHHVVEEMSIASGTPLPAIYVIDDAAINAFAAGHGPADAAIVVTRGCLEQLDRDQLQGVIAHEFSHLLNGDTRLNLQLIGWAFGLLVLALAGRMVLSNLNFGALSDASSSRSDRKNGGSALVLMLAIGVSLVLVGYIGYFFANLLKAGVSRQRECLADASAVQFTRNPNGIAGALKRIGRDSYRSQLEDHRAVELSHLFFADGVPVPFLGLLATHPPLAERIRAIDPQWNGSWDDSRPIHPRPPEHQRPAPSGPPMPAAITRFTPEHVAFGAALLSSIPQELVASARVPFSARAVALLVTLEAAGERAACQLQALEQADPQLARECRQLWPRIQALGDGARLPLLNLCTPALRQLIPQQREAFIALERQLAASAGEPPLAQYVLMRMLRARLAPPSPPSGVGILSLAPLKPACELLLGEMAWVGADDADQAQAAFRVAVGKIGAEEALAMPPVRASASQLDAALDQLLGAGVGLRRRILTACTAAICADGKVTVSEAELLRAVADIFGCPLPPFLDAQQPLA